jgi:hypothetical protein
MEATKPKAVLLDDGLSILYDDDDSTAAAFDIVQQETRDRNLATFITKLVEDFSPFITILLSTFVLVPYTSKTLFVGNQAVRVHQRRKHCTHPVAEKQYMHHRMRQIPMESIGTRYRGLFARLAWLSTPSTTIEFATRLLRLHVLLVDGYRLVIYQGRSKRYDVF